MARPSLKLRRAGSLAHSLSPLLGFLNALIPLLSSVFVFVVVVAMKEGWFYGLDSSKAKEQS